VGLVMLRQLAMIRPNERNGEIGNDEQEVNYYLLLNIQPFR
jgi:hypothetical protein